MKFGIPANQRMTVGQKLWQVNWSLIFFLIGLAIIGCAMLYSAGDANWDPWAKRQLIRFGIGLLLIIMVAITDIRIWLRYAYPLYFLVLGLLIAVDVIGVVGGGAQRWINLGIIQLQPSEIMKITLVLALAKFFHSRSLEEIVRPTMLIIPLLLLVAPVL